MNQGPASSDQHPPTTPNQAHIQSHIRINIDLKTMKNVPNSKLGDLYREHINLILQKDIEAILKQYAPDALLISSFEKTPKVFRGRDELRSHFQGILGIEGLETDIAFWGETENPTTLMIVEAITMTTPDGEAKMRFADSWVLNDRGEIQIHFAGMTQYPDGSVA
jgi:ketosteroid isomerase-like protein